jgi:hypothetical protein
VKRGGEVEGSQVFGMEADPRSPAQNIRAWIALC